MVASTNHLDKLDPGLSSRPSRFDRKYLFPLPSEDERKLYCQFWRRRLKAKKVDVEFPKKICSALALITDGFSFAYIQEAFVATLLAIALRRSEFVDEDIGTGQGGGNDSDDDDDDEDLDKYELWRELKKTVKALRNDMDTSPGKSSTVIDQFEKDFALEREAQAPDTISSLLTPVEDRPDTKREQPCVRGMLVDVDHQNLPIITEEGKFALNETGRTEEVLRRDNSLGFRFRELTAK